MIDVIARSARDCHNRGVGIRAKCVGNDAGIAAHQILHIQDIRFVLTTEFDWLVPRGRYPADAKRPKFVTNSESCCFRT